MTKIVLKAQLEAKIKKDRAVGYVAFCPALDVTSQGATVPAALNALTEAVQAFLEFCFETGRLDAALHELGFTAMHTPESGTFQHSQHTIEVPMELVASAANRARLLEASC